MKRWSRSFLATLLAWAVPALASSPALAAEDAAKLDGDWVVQVAAKGTTTAMSSAGIGKLSIKSDKAEWTKIRNVFDEAGKGTIEVDASAKPARLTIKAGDNTYKGVYRRKGESLTIVLSEAGGDYPPEVYLQPPRDFKGAVVVLIAEIEKPDGVWLVQSIRQGDRYISGSDTQKLTIKDDTIEWTAIPPVFDKPGKGSIKVDSSKKLRRLTVKDGDTTYKGIYLHAGKNLRIVLSEPGGDFPTKLSYLPTDNFKGMQIFLLEAKK